MRTDKREDEKFQWDFWAVFVIVFAIFILAVMTMEVWLPH